jgi:serine/threonine protein kinase
VSTSLHSPDGTPVRPRSPPDLVPGYRLGRYELLFPVGSGGMASVWAARLVAQHGFEKVVAIKTILPAYANDSHFQKMFLDEARTSARIDHANVVRVIDLGDEGGVLFLVMEWVEGETLSSLGHTVDDEGKSIPLGVLLRIAADACAGLHAAHELEDRKGIPLDVVHRDVSPQNIMVSKQGIAKVIDFGIAKARDRTVRETEVGAFKGKLQYLAPEQALAPKTIDRRTDVWAVGAVLYRYLAGRAPYETENAVDTVAVLQKREAPPPLPDDVPAPIQAVVSRALAWAADDRYPTAEALRVALEAAMLKSGIFVNQADVAAHFGSYMARGLESHKKAIALALGTEVPDPRSRASQRAAARVEEPDPGSRVSGSDPGSLVSAADPASCATEPDPGSSITQPKGSRSAEPAPSRATLPDPKAETASTGVVTTLAGSRSASRRRWSRVAAVGIVVAGAAVALGFQLDRGSHSEPAAGAAEPGSASAGGPAAAACVDGPPEQSAITRPPPVVAPPVVAPPLVAPPVLAVSAKPAAASLERPARSAPSRHSSAQSGSQRTPSSASTVSKEYYGF